MSARTQMLGWWFAVSCLLAAAGCGSQAPSPSSTAQTPEAAPTSAPAGREPERPRPVRVLMETSLGSIIVELDREKAPLTVDNFLTYVDEGEYQDTIFHQVNQHTVLGGGYTRELQACKTRTPIFNEAANGLSNVRGTIAMARRTDAIDSATNIFFFNVADNQEYLDHKSQSPEGYGYCVFGKVVAGLEVLDKIASLPVRQAQTADGVQLDELPVETVMIQSVRRIQ